MSEYTTKKAMKLANLKENNFFKSTWMKVDYLVYFPNTCS